MCETRKLPPYVAGWFLLTVNPDITSILMERVFGLAAGEDHHLARLSRAAERAYDLILYDYNGTLVETLSGETFPRNVSDWRLMPNRQRICEQWHALGARTAVVTNQGGVAFGYHNSGDIAYQIEHIARDLGMIGNMICYGHPKATIDRYRTSPDDDWRKPGPAMLLFLMELCAVTPERTLMVGDRPEDAEAAERAGVAFQWAHEHFGDAQVSEEGTHMTTTPLPTRGQQRILQFAGRANRRLRGHRDAVSGEVTYRIVELSAEPPPRDVMPVTSAMVNSLVDAGWIEVAQGTRLDWEYHVTQAGIAAANGPSRQQ